VLFTALLLCLSLLTAAPPSRAAFATAGGRCFQGAVLKGLGKTELAEQSFSECKAEAPAAKPQKELHWWSKAATAAKDILGVIGFVLLGLALILLIGWSLALTFSWLVTWVPNRLRKIRTWGNEPHRPTILSPTLTVSALDDTGFKEKMGPAIAALIRARFDPSSSPRFEVVTGHAAIGESLKPLGEISDEAKAAMSIIAFFLNLMPNRDFEAGGSLHAAGARGSGITLQLTKDGSDFEAETLWSTTFSAPHDDEKAMQFLAIPAAAWIEHRVAARLRKRGNLPRNPKVWMLFSAGLACHQQNRKVQARTLYESALELDPTDSWSMSNLGQLESRDRNFERALELLEPALKALEKKRIPHRRNPDWYRASYNVAMVYSEWSAKLCADKEFTKGEDRRQKAHALGEELANGSLEQLKVRWWKKGSKALRALLEDSILPGALNIYVGNGQKRIVVNESRAAKKWKLDIDERGWRRRLGYEHKRRESYKKLLAALDEQEALDYLLPRAKSNPRIRYNLACAWAHRGDDLKAATNLSQSINRYSKARRSEFIGLARTDPSFLRLEREKKGLFEKALAGKL
jgi:tetratricopeptide (TPR) repeat protein